MKAYKIAVPVADVIHGEPQTITRHEIHELLYKKAVELGYDEYNNKSIRMLYDNEYYALFRDGSHGPCNGVIIKINRILWRDFLKLTPDDVNDTDVVETQTPDNNKQALLDAFTAGWDAAHNNRFSIGVNFDKWYHEKTVTPPGEAKRG